MTQRKMKDSDVAWIGQVPEGWKVTRLKYVSKLDPEIKPLGLSTDDIVSFAPMECIRFDCRVGKESPLSRDNGSYSSFQNGDIAMAKVTPCFENGNICNMENLKNGYCFGSSELYCIRADGMARKYLFYVLANPGFIAGGVASMTGMGGLKRVTSLYMRSQFIPMPDVPEQRKIAAFLDGECGKIDVLRGKVEKQIAALGEYRKSVITEAVTKGIKRGRKMKPSGVEWIGEVPDGWKIERGKYFLRLLNRPVKDNDGVITCFRDGEVTLRSNRREEGFTFSFKECGYQGVEPGDLVVHGMDGFAGAIGISDSRGKASPVLNVLDTEHDKRYVMYYLRSMAYCDVFTSIASGIRVRSCDLRWNKLAELRYPLPPLIEEKEIADHIEHECNKVEKMVAKCREELDRLAEYKKSLIYEYVTGKKEVA